MDRPIPPTPKSRVCRWARKRRLTLTAALSVVGLAAALAPWMVQSQPQALAAPSKSISIPREKIQVSTVRTSRFEDYLAIRGRVQAEKNLAIESLESGRVDEVFVQAGQRVEPGDPIARIYNPTLAFEVLSLKTQMSAQLLALHSTQNSLAEAEFLREQSLAKLSFERARWKRRRDARARMQAKGALGELEVQEAQEELEFHEQNYRSSKAHQKRRQATMKLQLKETKSAADSLKESYEVAKQRLESLTIKAPASGEISQLDLDLGSTIGPGTRIANLLVQGPNKVVASVDEYFIDRIHIGQRAELATKQQKAQLRVSHIDPVVKSGKVSIDLRFEGEEAPGLFRGQAVDLRLFSEADPGDQQVLVVDYGEFFNSRSSDTLFVLNEAQDQAVARKVRLGKSNRKEVEVLSGLKPGDKIISSSYLGYDDVGQLDLQTP